MKSLTQFVLRLPAPVVFLALMAMYFLTNFSRTLQFSSPFAVTLHTLIHLIGFVPVPLWIFSLIVGLPGVSVSQSRKTLALVALAGYALLPNLQALSALLFGDAPISRFFLFGQLGDELATWLGILALFVGAFLAARSLISAEMVQGQARRSLIGAGLQIVIFPIGVWFIQFRVRNLLQYATNQAGGQLSADSVLSSQRPEV